MPTTPLEMESPDTPEDPGGGQASSPEAHRTPRDTLKAHRDAKERQQPLPRSAAKSSVLSLVVGVLAGLTTLMVNYPLHVAIGLVVILGSVGLALRGWGELKKSPELKAYGYFCGAAAFAATATAALTGRFL